MMTEKTGLFLTFEGPDGAGKTTQIALLADALLAAGHTVCRTREPGGDAVGERVRDLLLNGHPSPEAELLLFAAARAQNVQQVVRPALSEGQIVLCDRYTDSTLAYQGYGRDLSRDLIYRINHFATGGLVPDRTFLLDIDPAEGLRRRDDSAETNRLDRETLVFHEKVRAGFLFAAQAMPARIIVLDAHKPVEEIAQVLQASVFALIQERQKSAETTDERHGIL